MGHEKHLRELLREDQEPFQLHNYIAQKHSQLKTTTSSLQPKKHLILNHTSSSSSTLSLYRKACFFSFQDSPDLKMKSPLPSPTKSPCKTPTIFLNIPAKTAAMLLEAAMKIHKQSTKPKTHVQYIGFGLLGSFFKKLRDKNKAKKHVNAVRENMGILSNTCKTLEEISEDIRLSSAGWSESNEEKSMDMESSCSTSRSDFSEDNDVFSCQTMFCISPSSSPFRFALEKSCSAAHTPCILSPAASPVCYNKEDDDKHEDKSLQEIQVQDEERDQCSPVSVLDPPFEDDDEQHRGDEEIEEDSDYDVECSYAILQRTKLQLLHKLRRFERLAELDPVELEKRMLEDHEEVDELHERDDVNITESVYMQENLDEVVREVISRSNQCDQNNKIPSDFRRLLSDLVAEERKNGPDCTDKVMVSKVCKRLNAWKEVESNTIDMMVELDFRKELGGWIRYEEEVQEKARDIELGIFCLLVEELVS